MSRFKGRPDCMRTAVFVYFKISLLLDINHLTLKGPITTAVDNILNYFNFSKKTSFDILCESSAWQMIHIKCQDLFSLKN